jgi:hypothetical protein
MPFPNIRVTVVRPDAPTHVSRRGEPTTISVKGLVKYIVITVDEGEGLGALELDTSPSVEELAVYAVEEVVGPKETSVLGLLYPDEAAASEVLALEVSGEVGVGLAAPVDIWELPPEPIADEKMTSVWLLEVWAVESDSDMGALGEVAALDVTGTELDIRVLVLSSPKLLDNCEVITDVITVNESMAEV